MAIGTFAATAQGGTLHFTICPNWNSGACECPIRQVPQLDANSQPILSNGKPVMVNDLDGTLATPHPVYRFGATPPAGFELPTAPAEYLNLGKTQTQWVALPVADQYAFMCLVEAIRLVHHHRAQGQSTPVSSLIGVTA